MRSGHICGRKDLILKSHGAPRGVNATSTCSIRMAMSCRLLGRCNEWARRTRSVWRCQSIRAPVGALCLDTGYTSTIRLGKGCQLTRTWTVRPGAGLNHQFSYMSSGRSASYSRSEETLRCGKLPPEGIPITPSSNNTQYGPHHFRLAGHTPGAGCSDANLSFAGNDPDIAAAQGAVPPSDASHHRTCAPCFCVIGGTMPFIRTYSTSCP